jgi:hypothetical protein
MPTGLCPLGDKRDLTLSRRTAHFNPSSTWRAGCRRAAPAHLCRRAPGHGTPARHRLAPPGTRCCSSAARRRAGPRHHAHKCTAVCTAKAPRGAMPRAPGQRREGKGARRDTTEPSWMSASASSLVHLWPRLSTRSGQGLPPSSNHLHRCRPQARTCVTRRGHALPP